MRSMFFILIIFISGGIDAQIALDKQKHYVAGIITATTGYEVVYRITGDKRKARCAGVLASILVGVMKETFDAHRPGAGFDPEDLSATILGGLTFGITIKLLDKRRHGKTKKTWRSKTKALPISSPEEGSEG